MNDLSYLTECFLSGPVHQTTQFSFDENTQILICSV